MQSCEHVVGFQRAVGRLGLLGVWAVTRAPNKPPFICFHLLFLSLGWKNFVLNKTLSYRRS